MWSRAMLRILIADDHAALREALRALIESHPDWEICGEAADGQQAFELARREEPDVAVLAVNLPTMSGIELTRRLRQQCPTTRVLLFTLHDDDKTVTGGLAAGARGYVLKTDDAEHLEAAISALGANRSYVSGCISDRLMAAVANDRPTGRRTTTHP
jgi:DNA-binding NarL/FixJ family response regulator